VNQPKNYITKYEDRIDISNDFPYMDGVESAINSSDAIEMVSHGSEFIIDLVTPIGTRYVGKTKFIGRHSDNFLLLELPDITEGELDYFFQEGFRMEVKAISTRGEGALISFRSQVINVMLAPIGMLMISLPSMMKITQLREDTRYDVNLRAQLFTEYLKLECQLRDLSKGGCRFTTSPLAKAVQIGQRVSIRIIAPKKSIMNSLPLSGEVCNLQCSTHYAKYGVKFDETSRIHAKTLFKQMKFDVNKLELKF
jgi:c-di-GMP-binding flagellar brake protein YcgR